MLHSDINQRFCNETGNKMRGLFGTTLARIAIVCCAGLYNVTVAADPASHYMIHCMGCHLADGSGLPGEVPAFNEDLVRLMQSDDGRDYLVRVPGASQAPLSDSELASVLKWIVAAFGNKEFGDKEFGNTAPNKPYSPFTGAEITQHRSNVLLNPVQSRAALIP